jgi:hypothetical protein
LFTILVHHPALRQSERFVTAQVIPLMGVIDRSRASTSQRVDGTARRHSLPR